MGCDTVSLAEKCCCFRDTAVLWNSRNYLPSDRVSLL
jgi:hypothetical protein